MYRLGLIIGRGGLGGIYDAVDTSTAKPVAVKVLHPHVLARPDQFRRFSRELKIAAALKAPNIVSVWNTPSSEDSFPYMAMERLYGENLAETLARGPFESTELCQMITEVARGLSAAHQDGVVHRDIKPGNLFRLDEGTGEVSWKILDFGVCREVDSGSTVTEFGTVLGTPGYMAHEQARQPSRCARRYLRTGGGCLPRADGATCLRRARVAAASSGRRLRHAAETDEPL